jgi:FkbM family methyltransferase
MTTAYSEFLKEGSLAFDIGAYAGSRTDMFLEIGCSRVITVEPVTEYADRLVKKYENDKRIIVVSAAAGPENGIGSLKIHRQEADSALSSMSQEWIASVEDHPEWGLLATDWSESRMVPIITIDSLIGKHGEPDFIKIDVEGWEQEVIKGLTKPVKALSFEFHSLLRMDWSEQVIDYLLELGNYEFNYDVSDSTELASSVWLDKTELFWQILDKNIYGDIFARRV